jgi:hypothetical protein
MSAAPRLEFRLDPRAGAAFREFARRAGPDLVERFTKALAFDAARRTTQALTTEGAVGTGRYRAAWSTAALLATGQAAGSRTITRPPEGAPANPPRATDADATVTGAGMMRTRALINNVPYGPEVEYGTPETPAGLHLTRSVAATRKTAERMLGAMLRRAWRR